MKTYDKARWWGLQLGSSIGCLSVMKLEGLRGCDSLKTDEYRWWSEEGRDTKGSSVDQSVHCCTHMPVRAKSDAQFLTPAEV